MIERNVVIGLGLTGSSRTPCAAHGSLGRPAPGHVDGGRGQYVQLVSVPFGLISITG